MEDTIRPSKRPRLSFTPGSPEEATEDLDLQTARAQNDMRLKSIFEGIFAKYGKDFTEVGDEIDLETGKVVVDNGHLLGMRDESDTGEKAQAWLVQAGLSEWGGPAVGEDGAYDLDEAGRGDEFYTLAASPDAPSEGSVQDGFCAVSDFHDERKSVHSVAGSSRPHHDSSGSGTELVSEGQRASQPGQGSAPEDRLWQVPDLPQNFSTPTKGNRRFDGDVSQFVRSASPPGAGSLWTVPRRGRPRTDGKPPKPMPNKRRPRTKRKHRSSPVTRDWSFADTPDGSESDDPLQEFQPSPTPSKVMNIRGKHMHTPAPVDTHGESDHQSSHSDPIPHDRTAPAPPDDGQDDHWRQPEPQPDVRFEAPILQSDSTTQPRYQAAPAPAPEDTPTKSRRAITPDEAKLIVCMRYTQRKKWNDILGFLPGRKLPHLYQWNALHWTERRTNPPQLSAPWSQAELEILARLKAQSGLSWAEIRAALPRRSQAEIEIELFRLWVGDSVWNGEGTAASVQDVQTHAPEEQAAAPLRSSAKYVEQSSAEEALETAPWTSDDGVQPDFEQLVAEDDSIMAVSEASSPSKLSAIQLDSPAPSRTSSKSPKRVSPTKRLKWTI